MGKRIKADCYRCKNFRLEKDYLQQKDCKLELQKSTKCEHFIDRVEWAKYMKMMKGEN